MEPVKWGPCSSWYCTYCVKQRINSALKFVVGHVKCTLGKSKVQLRCINQIKKLYRKNHRSTRYLHSNYIQGVSTSSEQSNLLISPTQNWFIFDGLGSNSPQDKNNLYGGIGFYENSIYYL